ncbi:MAG: accessory factor UbiK family protein [Pseudomonadota bacterium]
MNSDNIEALARRLAASVPDSVRAFGGELESNFQSVLKSAFERMDLVTREEFDIQRGVLAKTRATVEALEARLAELEGREPDGTD